MEFENYDNPARAKRIWNEYVDKNTNPVIKESAKTLALNHKTADGLDLALDKLTTDHKQSHFCSSPPSPIDSDSNGCLANAIRALEERD